MKPIINLKNSWELSYDEFQKVLVFSKKDTTGDEERKVSYDLEPEVWNQLSVVRESGELRFYVNGQLIESPIQDESNYGTSDKLFIGKSDEAYFEGWVEQLKVSKGLAKYLCDFTPRNFKGVSDVSPTVCYRLDKNYAASGDVCSVDEVNKSNTSDPFSFASNENFQIKANTNFNDNFTISFELSWDDAHTGTILFLGDAEKDLHILKLSVSETNSKKLRLTYVQRDASEKTFETIELVNSRFSTIKLIGDVDAQKLSVYSDGILVGEDVEYDGLVKSRDMFPDMQDILQPWQYNNAGNIIYAHGYPAPRTNYKFMYTRKFHLSNFRKVFDPLYIPKYDIDPVTCEKTKERYVWGSNMKVMGGIQTVIWFKNPITIKADSEIFNYYQYTHRCIGRCGLKNVRRNIFSKTLGYGHSGHVPSRYKVRGCLGGHFKGTWRVRPQHWMSGRTTQEIKDVAYIMTRGETSNCGGMMSSAKHSRLGVDGILWDNGISESDPYGQLSDFKFVIGHPLSHQPTTQEQHTFTGNIKNFYFIDGVSTVDECVVCEYQEPLVTPTPTPTPVDVIFEVSEDPERIEIETYTGEHPSSGDDEMTYTFTTKNVDKITYTSSGDWDVEDWSWYDGTEWKQNTASLIPVTHLTEVKFKLNANRSEGSHDLDMVFTGTNESTGESISHNRQLKATVTHLAPVFEVSDDPAGIEIEAHYTGEHPVSGDDEMKYNFNIDHLDKVTFSAQDQDSVDWEWFNGAEWVGVTQSLTPITDFISVEELNEIKFRLKENRPEGSHDLNVVFTGTNESTGKSTSHTRLLKATITHPVPVFEVSDDPVGISFQQSYEGEHPFSGDDEMKYNFNIDHLDKVTFLAQDQDSVDWEYFNGTEWKQVTQSLTPITDFISVEELNEIKFRLKENRPVGSHDLDIVFTGTNTFTNNSTSYNRQLRAIITPSPITFEVSDDPDRIGIDISYTGEHPASEYIEYSVTAQGLDDIILSTQDSDIEDWEHTGGLAPFGDLAPSFSIKGIVDIYGKIKFRLKADRPTGSHDLDVTFTGINNSTGESISIDRQLKATVTMIPVEVETIGQNTVTWEYPEDSSPTWTAKVKGKLVNDGDGVGSVKVYVGHGVNGSFSHGAFTELVGEFNQDDEFEYEFSSKPQDWIEANRYQYAFKAVTQDGISSPISETMYLVNNGTRLNNFNIRFDPTKPGYLRSSSISGTDLSGDFTFTWFQHLRMDEEKRRIFKTSGFGDSASAGFSLYSENGVILLEISNGASSFSAINQAAYPWLFDKWVHVALEFDRESNWVKCYIDGSYFAVLARPEHGFTSDVDFTSNRIEIGSSVDSDGGTYPLNGNIDNFQIYDKKLNATELLELSDRQHNNPHKFGAKHAWLMGDGYRDTALPPNYPHTYPVAEGLPVHFVQDIMSDNLSNYGLTSEPGVTEGVTYNYAPDFETFHCIKPVLGETVDGKQYRLVYDNDIPNADKHIPWPSRYEDESIPLFASGIKPSIYTNGQETIIDNNYSPADMGIPAMAYLIKDTKPLDFDGSYLDWITQKFAEYKSIPKTEYYFKHDQYTGISSPYTDEIGAVSAWFHLNHAFSPDGGHFGTLMTLQSGWSLAIGGQYGQMSDCACAMYGNGWYYGFLLSDYTPPAATWSHLVINWNEQDKEYQFYINGVKMKTVARLYGTPPNPPDKTKITSSSIHIGRRNDKNMAFQGAIADIAIYKNAITEEKALELYNNGISPADASDAEIWYRMGNDDTITHEFEDAIPSEELPLITTNSGTLGTDFNATIHGHGPDTTREYRTVGEYSPGIHNPTASAFANKLNGRGNFVGGECFSPLSNFISTDALWHISADASGYGISSAGVLNGAADLTGNKNHFISGGGSVRSVPGYFDSSIKVRPYYHMTNGGHLVLNNAVAHGSSFTFAIVVEHNSKNEARPYGSWNHGANQRYFQIRNNESTQEVYIGKDGSNASAYETYSFPYESNTQVLEIWRYNSSNNTLTKYMYSEQDSGSVTSHEYLDGADELHNQEIKFALGYHLSGESNVTANIKLYEAIWFDSALFGGELNSLVTYLNDKHKVTETPQTIEINSTTADFIRKS